jgi:IMP cyclohydrolase
MPAQQIAEANLERHLRRNPYPGRGLVIGPSSAQDAWLMIYWIMGRSAGSRNRRFVAQGGSLRTEPIDARLLADPSLIIYEAMLELPGIYLVSNGAQTRALLEGLQAGETFDSVLSQWEREPDAPNFTPRITAMLDLRGARGALTLSLLKANPANPELTDRFTLRPAAPPPGLGVGITTYQGDGNPLPSFSGDPLLLPCGGSAEQVLDLYWNALDAENKISLAIKRIPLQGGASEIIVRNRFGNGRARSPTPRRCT